MLPLVDRINKFIIKNQKGPQAGSTPKMVTYPSKKGKIFQRREWTKI